MKKALFLDRDGTLIWDKDYLCDPDGVVLIDGVKEALARFLDAGWLLFMYSNQSGVGRGYFDLDAVDACNKRMFELLGWGEQSRFSAVCIAPEAPDEPSDYRKPSARFPTEMFKQYGLRAENCWMVGDRMSDWKTGQMTGMNIVAVETGKVITSEHRDWLTGQSAFICKNFPAFADVLLNMPDDMVS